MKRIGSCSFGISNKEFSTIKFSSNKQGREENISAINKEKILKAAKLLYDNGEYEDALLIHIMWSIASRPNEMVTSRFEDFEDNNNQKSVLYYANKKNQRKRITIADNLCEQVVDFKNFKNWEWKISWKKFNYFNWENIDRTFCIWFNKIKTSKEILEKV